MATQTRGSKPQNEPAATLSCNLSIVDSSTPTAVKLRYCKIRRLEARCVGIGSDSPDLPSLGLGQVISCKDPCIISERREHALFLSVPFLESSAGHVKVAERHPASIPHAPHQHTQFSVSGPGRCDSMTWSCLPWVQSSSASQLANLTCVKRDGSLFLGRFLRCQPPPAPPSQPRSASVPSALLPLPNDRLTLWEFGIVIHAVDPRI